jgi:hypothetical protein
VSDLDFERDEKVLLAALVTLNDLRDAGMVDGDLFDMVKLTPKARTAHDQFKAEGFEPSKDELQAAVRLLVDNPDAIEEAMRESQDR